MSSQSNNSRIAKNTLYLYLRTLFVMSISIFTSRIVLDVLGVEDYGIYNVVGGFVSMFSVLSGTLTAASQRYIAYELGKEESNVQQVFSTTITIHLILAVIIFLLLESIGLWFINYKMNISSERLFAANCVFQCSILTFCVSIISIPYNAAIIAYEKMSTFAYIAIFEVTAKLAMIYALYIINFDSLIVYAVFMLIIAIILRLIYSLYVSRNFRECRYRLNIDRPTLKSMISFSGWNFIGSTAGIMNNQGINILTNLFFSVVLNAARGIATQVDNAISSFVQNFMMALNPQITKSYAAKDYAYVNALIIKGTKFASFLFFILFLPVMVNTDFILSVWLKQVPEKTALFLNCAIIYTMCQTLSQCLYIAMLATGDIKKYQIIVGTLSLLAFPVAYVFFKMGLPAEYGYISMILFSLICLAVRLMLLKEMIPMFSPVSFITKVLIVIGKAIIPVLVFIGSIHSLINEINWFSFIMESTECLALSLLSIYFIGLDKSERLQVKRIVTNRIRR